MNKQKQPAKQFGLPTAISMIIGIVIGSGIFFKTDDILIATDSNILIGVFALIIGAISIIFGGLTLSQLARTSDKAGGIITYAELAYNRAFAFVVGFFQLSIYYPTLIAIIIFVAANYTLTLFPSLNLNIWLVSIGYFIIMFAVNFISSKLSSVVQSASTLIKLIPLILIGVLGVIFGNPESMFQDSFTVPLLISSSSAIVSVAFSYDGWTITTSIAHEVKDSRRNTPLALCIAPLIVMCVYLIYFIGMSSILGPEKIIALGDAHVAEVAAMYFGPIGTKLILITIIISVLGTVNGLILGGSRLPYSLAVRKELPYSNFISKLDDKTDIPRNSLLVCAAISILWLLFHYATTKVAFLSNIDISSIPIVMMYGFYLLIYIGIVKQYIQTKNTSIWFGLIFPLLAGAGASIIIYGGVSGEMFPIYGIISLAIVLISVTMYKNSKEVNK